MILIKQDNTRPLTDIANVLADGSQVEIYYTDKKISVLETHQSAAVFEKCLVNLTELEGYDWDDIEKTDTHLILKGTGEYKLPLLPYRELPYYIDKFNNNYVDAIDIYKRHKNFYSDELNGYIIQGKHIITTDGDVMCITRNFGLKDGVYDPDLFEIIHKIKEQCTVTTKDDYYVVSEHYLVRVIPDVNNYPKYDVLGVLTFPKKYDIVVSVRDFKNTLKAFSGFENVVVGNKLRSENGQLVESFTENMDDILVNVKTLNRVLTRMRGDVKIRGEDNKLFLEDDLGMYIMGGIK